MNSPVPATDRPVRQKLLVMGATGPTGRLIVSEAVSRGHEVTALVRSAERARDLSGAKLVVGDVRNGEDLRNALKGRDAVICALGTGASPFSQVTLLSTATKALVEAMKAESVARLVCITGMGAGDSRGHGGFAFDNLIFPLLLKNVYADKDRQEAIIRDSGLDWVLVRPTILNNKDARGSVRTLTDLSNFHGGSISRADVAKFLLDQLRSDTWLHRSPLITWE